MEKSCGAVIFRTVRTKSGKSSFLYLVLHYTEGHWDLPKGHIEAGESEEETARREIYEETGIKKLKFLPGFRTAIRYCRVNEQGKTSEKEAVFFLAKAKKAKVDLSDEHTDSLWLCFPCAAKKMTYGNARGVLRKADKFLSERN